MIRNELIKDSTIGESKNALEIPESCRHEFVKAMKVGYYKEFYKQGLITADQLEKLIAFQDSPDNAAGNNAA